MNAPLSIRFKSDLENDLHADPHEAWFGISSSFEEELNEAKAEINRLTELLDACTIHACGDHCQRPTCKRAMRNAIKRLAALVRDCMEENDESDPFRTEWEVNAQQAIGELKHFIQ